jgi:hypothetical protein
MSPYGKSIAGTFVAELAAKGFTIVCGMARGIDTSAHKGALSACALTRPILPKTERFLKNWPKTVLSSANFPARDTAGLGEHS